MTLTAELSKLEAKRLPLIPNYPSFKKWKRSAVAEKLESKPLCLYVHIPFCTQRCSFCYYKTVDLKERPEVEGYVETLCKEIEMVSDRFDLSDRPIHAVYFGGGTPSLLKPHQLEKLVKTLRKNFKHFENKKQFSFEAEPLTISQSKLDAMAELGVNRVSMGMQSFVDEIIKISGRGHDEKQAYRAIELAQKAGKGKWNLNIDLLSGLAGETQETWEQSVERAIATGVESITVYKMEAFANTEVYQTGVKQETVQLPSEEQELRFMEYAMERFERANYLPWCHFTYTKDGCDRSEYTVNIWQGVDFYGLGVSAFGCMGGSLLQNTSDLEKYASIVGSGELPLARGYNLSCLDLMVREVLLGIKLLRVDLERFKKRYGLNLKTLCASVLTDLELDGFISVSDKFVELTSKGILYGDFVGVTISDHLRKSYE